MYIEFLLGIGFLQDLDWPRHYILGTIIQTVHVLSAFIVTIYLQDRNYYTHFTDETLETPEVITHLYNQEVAVVKIHIEISLVSKPGISLSWC